ncbi:hypothetical protein [Haloferax sp. DFSO60]|uniref:hypothetical protein n=1 Tax=Haloferax sp. DFSO60 TaxID=3388652 RepID=UPI00397A719A
MPTASAEFEELDKYIQSQDIEDFHITTGRGSLLASHEMIQHAVDLSTSYVRAHPDEPGSFDAHPSSEYNYVERWTPRDSLSDVSDLLTEYARETNVPEIEVPEIDSQGRIVSLSQRIEWYSLLTGYIACNVSEDTTMQITLAALATAHGLPYAMTAGMTLPETYAVAQMSISTAVFVLRDSRFKQS